MVVKKVVKREAEVEEESESESESEIEFEYNDAEDDTEDDESSEEEDDSDDPETEDSEDDEPETTQTTEKKKGKTSKLKRSAESGDDEANDASDEDDDENGIADSTTEQPKKKKRKKMSKLEKSTYDSSDDGESDEAGDGESGEEDDDDDDDDESDEEEEEEEEDEEVKAHAGFADALSKILGKKTVSTKKVILALGKTDREIKQIKDSKLPAEERESKEKFLTPQELEEQKMRRKLWLEMGKVKPKPLERNHEKDLKMIATRGVVQLFNAVKKQQKLVSDNLSDAHTVRKRDMVIESMNKKSFINLLQNTKVDVSMATAEKETIEAKEPERKIWSVLKDDFVIGTGKMKDWDKQDDLDLL